jgi:Yqey-like protein
MTSTTDAIEPLRSRLSADLVTAMKARDKAATDTLRCLLAVLDNAGAQDPKAFGSSTEVPRRSLTHNELQALMQAGCASPKPIEKPLLVAPRPRDSGRLNFSLGRCASLRQAGRGPRAAPEVTPRIDPVPKQTGW